MSAFTLPLDAAPARRAGFERWRRRSRTIRALRIILPILIILIFAGLSASMAYNTLTAAPTRAANSNEPIRLVNPHFVGRDDKGRPFVLTAITATRDPADYQRVVLDHPALVFDEGGADPMRITGHAGVFHEGDGKLELSGGVRMSSIKAAFDTATSLFDTKTGEVVGSGPIQGSGSLGEISAKSYAVYGKGDHIIFKGGVHTRLDKK